MNQIARPQTEDEQARHYIEKQLTGRMFNGFVYDEHNRISGFRLGPKGNIPDQTFQFVVGMEPTLGIKEIE